jgi:hypothetical protein
MHLLEGNIPFGFIGHPRTGSRAVKAALAAAGAMIGDVHHVDHEILKIVRDEGGLVACTVRNPYDLVVSWYYYQEDNVKRSFELVPRRFDEWVESALCEQEGTASRFMRDPFFGYELCDHAIRFEGNIQDQLNSILAQCGIPPVEVKHEFPTFRRPYQEVYSPLSRAMVTATFQRELQELGYSF